MVQVFALLLLSEIELGNDKYLALLNFVLKINADLSNDLGNLFQTVLFAMIENTMMV